MSLSHSGSIATSGTMQTRTANLGLVCSLSHGHPAVRKWLQLPREARAPAGDKSLWLAGNGCAVSPRERPQSDTPPLELPLTSRTRLGGRITMNFSDSKNESLLSIWESVRRQVLANQASGGRSRCVGRNLRAYAELLRSEMDRRELKYTPIDWLAESSSSSAKARPE